LAACVQIDGPLRSFYRWQGQLCDETEYRLNCKTLPSLREKVIQLIRSCHPYELPEVLVVAGESLPDYAKWVAEQVAHEAE
jgi:periplasmic divalent cation tolerance protein